MDMLGELSENQIEQVLQSEVIGRLGCSVDSDIYVVPVTFAYHDKCLYAHSQEGLKISMMRKNPHVCFEIDTMENMANWRSVIVWGQYEELKTEKARNSGMKIIEDRLMPLITSETARHSHVFSHPPEIIQKESRAVVYRIRITKQTGRYEKTTIEQADSAYSNL